MQRCSESVEDQLVPTCGEATLLARKHVKFPWNGELVLVSESYHCPLPILSRPVQTVLCAVRDMKCIMTAAAGDVQG